MNVFLYFMIEVLLIFFLSSTIFGRREKRVPLLTLTEQFQSQER